MTLYNDILLRVYSYVLNYLSICKGLQSALLGEEMEFLSLSLTGSWQGVEIFQDGHSEETLENSYLVINRQVWTNEKPF